MGRYFVRVEGVNLGQFIYDCQDLNAIRGGSLMLLSAARLAGKHLSAVSTGASSGIFSFEADDAAAAEAERARIEEDLRRDCPHATFVVDVTSRTANFVHDREALLARNRFRQLQQATVVIPKENGDAAVREACKIDGVRPALHTDGGDRVSASIFARRRHGRRQRVDFYDHQLGRPLGRGWDVVDDLDGLSAAPERGVLHHKIAVIYVDGNSFGKIQNLRCTTEERQRQFDEYVREQRRALLENFLFDRVMRDKAWRCEDGKYRIQTLLWGGDEIIWVVPAWLGWQTLAFFYECTNAWKFEQDRLTHAGGLVFCNYKAPIHRMVRLARDLAGIAKEDRTRARFAYQALESFDHTGPDFAALRDFRARRYPGFDMVLAGDDMPAIAQAITEIKNPGDDHFPRSRLFDLLRDPAVEKTLGLSRPVRDALGALRALSKGAQFYHLAELWDYI